MDNKSLWISQSMEEWTHQIYNPFTIIKIMKITSDAEEELIRFKFNQNKYLKTPMFISTPTNKFDNYHKLDFETLLLFPKYTYVEINDWKNGCLGAAIIYAGTRMHRIHGTINSGKTTKGNHVYCSKKCWK